MKKILVIEDDPAVSENIKTLLEEEGYKVFCAADGVKGISLAKEENPDLIVCDIMLKDVDGFEVLKNLSGDPLTAVIPFIYLTARTDHEDLRTGMELGADDYLFKPFQSEELLRAIRIRLNKYRMLRAEFVEKGVKNEKQINKKFELNGRIFLKVNNQIIFVTVGNIKFITAENQYTNVFMSEGKSYLIRMPLSKWEGKLSSDDFYRIHRSTIINIHFIEKIEKWFNNSLKLYIKGTKEPFIVSRNYTHKFHTFE
ncbi:MAG TPA: response regulator [Ignavibacteriaceae bacterium]|nr:response regulator [Ignavibacteriaceae bacterium]